MIFLKTENIFSENAFYIGLLSKLLPILVLFFISICTYGQKFAVIGDYGMSLRDGEDVVTNNVNVKNLIDDLEAEFIITTGDNAYELDGENPDDIFDYNIGQFYAKYIYPYDQNIYEYGPGASASEGNRFFPCPGNHDYHDDIGGGDWYYEYFTLDEENNERYYEFVKGDVHLFSLNSNLEDPLVEVEVDGAQADWLQVKLAASESKYKIIYLHHPPYSSGHHGCHLYAQWPFAEWGATAVIAGDDHQYERLEIDGIPYFVNGAGGSAFESLCDPDKNICCVAEEAKKEKIGKLGAMLIEVLNNGIQFEFWSVDNETEQPNDALFIPDPNYTEPDIFITDENVSNTNPSVGELITLSCHQHAANTSVAELNPKPDIDFYVSDDTSLDDTDIYLGSENSGIGTSDPYDIENRNATVLDSWGIGTKYILFFADANDDHIESNEANNIEYIEININDGTSCPTNLTFTDQIPQGEHQVSERIFVNTNAKLETNEVSELQAGKCIFMEANTLIDYGSVFLAHIDECASNKAKPELTTSTIKVYPNPFNQHSTVEFELYNDSEVSIYVSDITGKKLATLTNSQQKTKGIHQVNFNAKGIASGIYYCTLINGNYIETHKMVITK